MFPGAKAVIVDGSNIQGNQNRTQVGVLIPTTRGVVGKAVKVRTIQECNDRFGKAENTDTTRYYVNKLLESGLFDVWVSPLGHFSDIDDRETISGSKAGNGVTISPTAEGLADGTITLSGAGSGAGKGTFQLSIYRIGNTAFHFPSVNIAAGQTPTQIAAAVVAVYNELQGFQFTSSAAVITMVAPVGSGADANTWKAEVTATGFANAPLGSAIVNLSGGTNGVVGGELVAIAKEVGTGYNGVVLEVAASKTNPGLVDIIEYLPGAVEVNRITNLATTLTQEQFDDINKGLVLVDLSSTGFNLPICTMSIGEGEKDNSLIVAADLIGSEISGLGWHSFGDVANLDYLVNLDFPTRSVDLALQSYTKNRNSFRFYSRTPIGLTPQGVLDYRFGQGSYSGIPFDSLYGRLICGEYVITDSKTTQTKTVSWISQVLIARAKTDQKAGKWTADSGYGQGDNIQFGFGQIRDPEFKAMGLNLIAPSLSAIASDINESGICPVVDHPSFGVTLWGNRSLLQNENSLFKFDSICNLAVHFVKVLLPIMEKRVFRAADPKIWRSIYRDATLEIDQVVAGKNNYPGGIEENYKWFGDQDVDSKSQAVENSQADLDAGKYHARFVFTPIGATEELTLFINAMDSQTFTFTFGK